MLTEGPTDARKVTDGPSDARKADGRSADILEVDESCHPSPKVAARFCRCTGGGRKLPPPH